MCHELARRRRKRGTWREWCRTNLPSRDTAAAGSTAHTSGEVLVYQDFGLMTLPLRRGSLGFKVWNLKFGVWEMGLGVWAITETH